MRITVELGRRDLLVVAGLPGAGKSTLLGRLSGDITVLDPDQVRTWFAARLPGTRYRYYRPIVHVWQRLRVAFAAVGSGPLIVQEPSTRATTRAWLVMLGAVTGRRVRMVWLEVTPEQALKGQHVRGRVLGRRTFERHVRRSARLRETLLAERVPVGWHSAQVLTRTAADRMAFVGAAA
ncbi:AAA family ATPase [Kutzneria chonburiensis]|uniref:AAA family ATPase n=1 Tax=Kutzneria chonburiensis TaxID=1483604 RepID=A0ABV6MSJ7_9PSEU|nr:AAA family ATPase [Kutzneria chonburiensis]